MTNSVIEILHSLVGPIPHDQAKKMSTVIDCFLHPKVSLFMPACGTCEYAAMPDHTHPAYCFAYYFEPVPVFILEGKKLSYDLSDGRCLSGINAGLPHQEVNDDGFQRYIAILIDKTYFEHIWSTYYDYPPNFRGQSFIPHRELLPMLRCFMLEGSIAIQALDQPIGNSPLLDHLAALITHLLIKSEAASQKKAGIQNPQVTQELFDRMEIDTVIAFMNSHYGDDLDLKTLAAIAGRSVASFTRTFKQTCGQSPIEYLNRVRLQKACLYLLKSQQNMSEIALSCGFNTPSYFSACFLEQFTVSPSAYRKQHLSVQTDS